MMQLVVAMDMCVVVNGGPPVQMPTYGVTVTAEKNVDFAKFTTYSWTKGHPVHDKRIDASVTDAVDRELSALGMMRAASGAGDVLAAYYSLSRTPNLRANASDGLKATHRVGTLVVTLLEPRSRRRLLRLRIDQAIDTHRAMLEGSAEAAVAALFSTYPTRVK